MSMAVDMEEQFRIMNEYDFTTDEMADDIVNMIHRGYSTDPVKAYADEFVSDYENVKNHLVMEVIPADGNEEFLLTVPHKIIGDMAIVYGVQVWLDNCPVASVPVMNTLLEKHGITDAELKRDAEHSAPLERPPVLMPWLRFLENQTGRSFESITDEDGNEITILIGTTTIGGRPGAFSGMESGGAVINYDGYLKKVSDELNGSFYMLPVAASRVLFIPESAGIPEQSLENIMAAFRKNEACTDRTASDCVYFYDSEYGFLETVDMFKSISGYQNKNG